MTHDCDFTPAKLFLCRVISTCFDASPEGKSDVCQMLYGRLQREDVRGLHEKELQFITKLGAGWEPSKDEALSFFRSTDPINELLDLIVAEWRDSISSTHSFVTWMISVQRWKDQYGLDSIEDELKELYLFVASIVASFLLLPFSALDSIVSSLLSFLRDEPAECIAFPSPLPPYMAQFSTAQRMAWVERFQSALYRSGDKFDLTALKSQLLRVTPATARAPGVRRSAGGQLCRGRNAASRCLRHIFAVFSSLPSRAVHHRSRLHDDRQSVSN